MDWVVVYTKSLKKKRVSEQSSKVEMESEMREENAMKTRWRKRQNWRKDKKPNLPIDMEGDKNCSILKKIYKCIKTNKKEHDSTGTHLGVTLHS